VLPERVAYRGHQDLHTGFIAGCRLSDSTAYAGPRATWHRNLVGNEPGGIWPLNADTEGIIERYVQVFAHTDDTRIYAVRGRGIRGREYGGIYAGPGTIVTEVLFKHSLHEMITYKRCRSITISDAEFRQECYKSGSAECPRFWGLG
jgi:hypothetical protein